MHPNLVFLVSFAQVVQKMSELHQNDTAFDSVVAGNLDRWRWSRPIVNADAEPENNKQINCWLGCCRPGAILSVIRVPAVPVSATASVIIWGWRNGGWQEWKFFKIVTRIGPNWAKWRMLRRERKQYCMIKNLKNKITARYWQEYLDRYL